MKLPGMSKKKRNKQRKKSPSTTNQPAVVKVSAVKRPPLQEWWLEHKRQITVTLAVVGITALIIIMIIGIVDIFI